MTRIYAIYDSKATMYAPPFFVNNDEVAKRTLCHTFANVGRCPLTEYPGDFSLFCIGEFDEDTGDIAGLGCKENLGTVLEIVCSMKSQFISVSTEEAGVEANA